MNMREILDLLEAEPSPQMPSILIVVHPGSACGSADYTIGLDDAVADRAKLVAFIEEWQGGLIVLSGEHDGELRLRRYRALGIAIDDALAAARSTGISTTAPAFDPAQERVSKRVLKKLGVSLDHPIVVTGAWASRGNSGCVNSVVDALRQAGFSQVELSGSAVFED